MCGPVVVAGENSRGMNPLGAFPGIDSTLSSILNDMASEAASSTLVLAELINTVQKVYMEKQKDVSSIDGSNPDYVKNCLKDIKRKNTTKQYDVGIGG
ncbi:hypothetical protein Tco_0438398 [Tanacetum coccineum]